MFSQILDELKTHAPFTVLGALSGIVVVVVIVYGKVSPGASENTFWVLHPLHVVLSALVTTAMYRRYGKNKLWAAVLIGYTGAVGIATISDSLIPYLGEVLINLPRAEAHIGFIEEWWLVNPAALLGIGIGYFRSTTRVPHAGHVLLSTWASLFHIAMALGETLDWLLLPLIFLFLFMAVWIPCCTSDIVYPLLFARRSEGLASQHLAHSHQH